MISAYEIKGDKVYIEPEMILISSDGIFINFQGNIISVSSIHTDANGTYFLFSDYCVTYEQDWECRRCGWVNNGDRAYCVKCNRARPW